MNEINNLISIIVPVYNLENYLTHSIGSILSQTYRKIEVIAVDDGSTDNSLDVLQGLKSTDERIQVIHQENGGVTKARLTGAAASQGEWIGFMDGDDYVEPDMYERLLDNAEKYKADISHCGYQMVFPSRIDYYYNTGRLICQNQETGLKDLIEGTFIEPTVCSKLFHRSLFHSLLHEGVMDCSIHNMEDLLMNYYLFRGAKLSVYEDFCPYHYMVRKGSASTSVINEHKLRDPILVFQTIKNDVTHSPELSRVTNQRIAGELIGLATMWQGKKGDRAQLYRNKAQKELRTMLPELLSEDYSIRTKILSTWAAIWPWSYNVSHRLYAKCRRTDRKYEVT